MSGIEKTAYISGCGRYRYSLGRRWDAVGPLLPFVMLNPSTADASVDDPTIRRCMGFARRELASGIVVVNLFAYRATSPKDLWKAAERHGPDNERAIHHVAVAAAAIGMPIVCAWGAGAGAAAPFYTVEYLRAQGARLVCLGKTETGHPRHPLYVKADQPLVPL